MELDSITQAILLYGPAVVSIVTMICTVIISIKKVASTTKSSLDEVKEINKANKELKEDMAAVMQENAQLKESIDECMNRMNNVAVPKRGRQ